MDLSFLNNLLAFLSASFLGLEFFENIIFVGSSTFLISNFCTGLTSILMLGALLFSMQKPKLFYRLKIFIFGALLLLVINIPRLMLILFSAKMGFNPDFIHTLTWFLMSGVVILVWYFCVKIYVSELSDLI